MFQYVKTTIPIRVVGFIAEHFAIKHDEIKLTSNIEADLGITGDDAVEMLLLYAKTFAVDISQFMAADYFNAEGASKIFCTYDYSIKPFFVADLVKGAIAGRLDEMVINDKTIIRDYL